MTEREVNGKIISVILLNLSKENILSNLNNNDFYLVDVVDSIASTNDEMKQKAQNGAKEGSVLVALSQTGGRGRLGRKFFSPQNTGLYMSIILKPDLKPEDAVLITTAAAVATSKAIDEVSGKNSKIKWVNDIYIDGKKVCGILTEAGFNKNFDKLDYVILGIGVNVYAPQEGFPEDIVNIADAVFSEAQNDMRSLLCAKILDNFYCIYKNLSSKDFVDEYINRSCVIGKQIKVIQNGTEADAKCIGIDNKCRLLVEYKDGNKDCLSTGEISIKVF